MSLISCGGSNDAEKMFGMWQGSIEKGGDKRTIKLEIREDNTFTLEDVSVFTDHPAFTESGNATMSFTYNGIIDNEGVFSIYNDSPWDDMIHLYSRDGNSEYTLNGETDPDIMIMAENNTSGSKLIISGMNRDDEDPEINGWYIRTGYMDAVYFRNIKYRCSTANLDEIKLTKK